MSEEFLVQFLLGLRDDSIMDSDDGDAPINAPQTGWFITPEKRIQLEQILNNKR